MLICTLRRTIDFHGVLATANWGVVSRRVSWRDRLEQGRLSGSRLTGIVTWSRCELTLCMTGSKQNFFSWFRVSGPRGQEWWQREQRLTWLAKARSLKIQAWPIQDPIQLYTPWCRRDWIGQSGFWCAILLVSYVTFQQLCTPTQAPRLCFKDDFLRNVHPCFSYTFEFSGKILFSWKIVFSWLLKNKSSTEKAKMLCSLGAHSSSQGKVHTDGKGHTHTHTLGVCECVGKMDSVLGSATSMCSSWSSAFGSDTCSEARLQQMNMTFQVLWSKMWRKVDSITIPPWNKSGPDSNCIQLLSLGSVGFNNPPPPHEMNPDQIQMRYLLLRLGKCWIQIPSPLFESRPHEGKIQIQPVCYFMSLRKVDSSPPPKKKTYPVQIQTVYPLLMQGKCWNQFLSSKNPVQIQTTVHHLLRPQSPVSTTAVWWDDIFSHHACELQPWFCLWNSWHCVLHKWPTGLFQGHRFLHGHFHSPNKNNKYSSWANRLSAHPHHDITWHHHMTTQYGRGPAQRGVWLEATESHTIPRNAVLLNGTITESFQTRNWKQSRSVPATFDSADPEKISGLGADPKTHLSNLGPWPSFRTFFRVWKYSIVPSLSCLWCGDSEWDWLVGLCSVMSLNT